MGTSLSVYLANLLNQQGPGANDTMSRILEHNIIFDSHVADDARQLIQKMLNSDPKLRPTALEALHEPWTRRMQLEFKIPDRPLSEASRPAKAGETARVVKVAAVASLSSGVGSQKSMGRVKALVKSTRAR